MSSSTDNGGIKKFLFDKNDFDKDLAEGEKPVFTEEQLIVAKMQAQQQGKLEGAKEASQGLAEQANRSLAAIANACEKLVAAEEAREVQQMVSATKMAMRIAHKLLPQFAERYSLNEIERVISKAIEARRDEPRIAITVPAMHLDALRQEIERLAHEKGFAGKVILLADDNMAPSDVRVEWADGGAERLYERLFSQVEAEFAKAIAGMQATIDDIKK